MPKHIVILLILLAGFLAAALVAKAYLTDPSFYTFGNYRADAVPEIAAQSPLHMGGQACLACHDGGFAFGSDLAHGKVQCEVCHGVDPAHPESDVISVPVNTAELCLNCHEVMPARPESHPQITRDDHPSPGDAGAQCHECHDPHSPGDDASSPQTAGTEDSYTGDAPFQADLAATISKCARCHGESGEGRKQNPAITGLEPDVFVQLFGQYASGERDHKLMRKYASQLSASEIAGLAEYYAGLAAESQE